jgi:ureidoglycolate dehydrogenase (NAD+)
VLTGALTGPRIGDDEQGLGHFFIALDISRFLPVDEFESRLAQLVSELHACQPAEGVTHIYVPGEIEMETAARRQREGIPLPPDIVKELLQLAEQVEAPFTFVE